MTRSNLLFAFVLTAGALSVACGSSSSTSTSGAGGAGSTDNGCTEATAVDHTKDAAPVVINFGGALGNKYSPACIIVAKGQSVTFTGNFMAHPLEGGTVSADGMATPATGSPIQATSTGMSATMTIANAGTFPYYCTIHAAAGMKGAIYAK